MQYKHNLVRTAAMGVAALLLAGTPAVAQVKTWTIDSRHSKGGFAVRHMMIAMVRGHLAGPVGTVSFDPKDNLSTVKAKATFDMKTIDTGTPDRDKSLQEDEGLLEVAKYPTMTFESTKSEPVGPGRFRLTGNLTLHGVTKPVVLDVEGPGPAITTRGVQHVGATATTRINRKDFGITWNRLVDNGGAVMGDEIQITIDLELVEETQPTR